jgi:hypothetical protein
MLAQKVNDFIDSFKPDLNRYVEKDIKGNIKTVKRPLTNELIMRFFSDMSSYRLSFFVRDTCRNYIGLDIDDHDEYGGWTGNAPSDFLRKKFAYVKSEIGKDPSMLFRSSRGIHAFWFLKQSLPNYFIDSYINEKLHNVEILPTMKHALVIPKPMEYLNSRLEPDTFLGYSRNAVYDPKDIFDKDYLPDSIKQKYKSGKIANGKRGMGGINKCGIFSVKPLEEIEAEYLPIKNGRSNEIYKPLVALYIARNLNPDQIIERFKELVAKSPGYTGGLLSGIKNRVASSYRNIKGICGTMEMGSLSVLSGDSKIQRIIEEILALEGLYSPKRVRMRNEHSKFLLHLFSSIRAYDHIQADSEYAIFWDYIYPKSWKYYQERFYPLPYSLMRQWNKHYDKHLRLLKEHGILEESPYGYSTTLKRCKYYRITRDVSPT